MADPWSSFGCRMRQEGSRGPPRSLRRGWTAGIGDGELAVRTMSKSRVPAKAFLFPLTDHCPSWARQPRSEVRRRLCSRCDTDERAEVGHEPRWRDTAVQVGAFLSLWAALWAAVDGTCPWIMTSKPENMKRLLAYLSNTLQAIAECTHVVYKTQLWTGYLTTTYSLRAALWKRLQR